MKVPDYDKYKIINKDTQLTPVRPGAVAAYLGIMGQVWMIMYVWMVQSQCECAAWVGSSAVCKHVCTGVVFFLHYKCLVRVVK